MEELDYEQSALWRSGGEIMTRVRPIYSNTFSKRRKLMLAVGISLLVLLIVSGSVWLKLRNPRPNTNKYPVLGVRLSQTDGHQDFTDLKEQGVQFVYLKATEGASYFDDNFTTNYSQATAGALAVGVYHYFSFGSSPQKQAAAFDDHVGTSTGSLPIGIEVAAYTKMPATKTLRQNLNVFIALLQSHYVNRIILIGTDTMLDRIGKLNGNPLRMVVSAKERHGRQGDFWQYANSAKLPGGDTNYQCLVYVGSKKQFMNQKQVVQ